MNAERASLTLHIGSLHFFLRKDGVHIFQPFLELVQSKLGLYPLLLNAS